MNHNIPDEFHQHAKQLMTLAVLSAMEFIADRLESSNQESYELVGFDDAISTIIEYYGYSIKYINYGHCELFHGNTLLGNYSTRQKAWAEAMSKILTPDFWE